MAPSHGERKILVVGYGNTLRGDDGIGYRVAESLQVAWRNRQVEVRALPLLPLELVLDLADARAVLFIDADCRLPPLRWAAEAVTPAAEPTLFMSHISPASLLLLTQRLCGRCPDAKLLRVGAQSFAFDERLSTDMSDLLPRLTSAARNLVTSWLSG